MDRQGGEEPTVERPRVRADRFGARTPPGVEASPRLWRWCVARTLRDGRLTMRHGWWISRANLERMFARRWARVSVGWNKTQRDELNQHGRSAIRRAWRRASSTS